MKKTIKILTLVMTILALSVSLIACSDKAEDKVSDTEQNQDKKEIKLGGMAMSEPMLQYLKEGLEPKGYQVEIVMFDGNHLPATALKDKSVDGVMLNHLPWLETFNKENSSDLKMAEPHIYYGRTAIYSSKHKSIDEIPEGATIAVPGDPSNMDRSLKTLESTGLIKLGEKTGEFYTLVDIAENPKNIKIIETEITATARSINDVDAIISGAYSAKMAGLDHKDFLFEDPKSKDFPFGLIVNGEDVDSQWVKDAIEISESEEYRAKFLDYYDNTFVLFDKK